MDREGWWKDISITTARRKSTIFLSDGPIFLGSLITKPFPQCLSLMTGLWVQPPLKEREKRTDPPQLELWREKGRTGLTYTTVYHYELQGNAEWNQKCNPQSGLHNLRGQRTWKMIKQPRCLVLKWRRPSNGLFEHKLTEPNEWNRGKQLDLTTS